METFNPHELPELPYDFGALEPVISGEIMELHYTKHHKGYVTKLNTALEQLYDAQEKMDLEKQIALQNAVQFNGGGHINHSIFWTVLAPEGKGGGGQPGGDLAIAINKAFGSFDAFVEKFSAATVAVQGSGWGWLGWCPVEKKVMIATCANQDPLSMKGLVPLFGVDVWEHAYYLQYKNVRPDYVKNIWRIANWKMVEERFKNAQ